MLHNTFRVNRAPNERSSKLEFGQSVTIRVLHLSHSDSAGGAARAAYRVHVSLRRQDLFPIESAMLVRKRHLDSPGIARLSESPAARLAFRVAATGSQLERRMLKTPNSVLHSTARIRTSAIRFIDRTNPDVVLLHWLGNRMLSVAQIGTLAAQRRPIAWRLPDTWAFCGAEHYPNDASDTRFVDGYRRDNRLDGEHGLDLNRLTWARKARYWTQPIQLITPSKWMADQVQRSALMRDWPVTVIPNPLDTAWWGAVSREDARQRLGIPKAHRIVLFGAIGGESDQRKGADLLRKALPHLSARCETVGASQPELVTFGGPAGEERAGNISVRSVGRLDDEGLRLYYSAADVMVVPSRQEAFGQAASESMACGTPVVAFAVGGLKDIVEDGVSGRLAGPFSAESLAEAIWWCIEDRSRQMRLSVAARQSSSRWESSSIGRLYAETLMNLLA